MSTHKVRNCRAQKTAVGLNQRLLDHPQRLTLIRQRDRLFDPSAERQIVAAHQLLCSILALNQTCKSVSKYLVRESEFNHQFGFEHIAEWPQNTTVTVGCIKAGSCTGYATTEPKRAWEREPMRTLPNHQQRDSRYRLSRNDLIVPAIPHSMHSQQLWLRIFNRIPIALPCHVSPNTRSWFGSITSTRDVTDNPISQVTIEFRKRASGLLIVRTSTLLKVSKPLVRVTYEHALHTTDPRYVKIREPG